ncbi:T9SS type A sorting domain-containing protein [Lewinella sp. 4G2]|uniref:T9SS type A sorting domain-containing protein n=1 Tax=Lewinella sp. 4G2 TaxID=1803372 RepID=UPI0035131677
MVFAISGRIVMSQIFNGLSTFVDLSAFNPGVYIISFEQAGKINERRKVVVQ